MYSLCKPSQINQVSTTVHSLIKYAEKINLQVPELKDNDFQTVKIAGRTVYLTKEEIEETMKLVKKEALPAIVILIFSGVRIAELMGLEWKDIDIVNKTISISKQLYRTKKLGKTKSGKSRIVPMHDNVHKALKMIAQSKGATWITTGRIFEQKTKHIVTKETKKLAKRFGKDVIVHSYRHTCASLLIQAGESLEKIGHILGQSSRSVTASYAHLCTASVHCTINALPNCSF